MRERLERALHVLHVLTVGRTADERVATGPVLRVHLCSRPDSGGGAGEPEAAWHQSNHCAGEASELERLADDRRIGPELLPQGVTEHRDQLGAHCILACAEGPAQERLRAEHVEELGRDRDARDEPHRSTRDFERQIIRAVRTHPLKSGEVRSEAQELLLVPRSGEPQDADLLLACDRQRIEQQRADHAEDRCRAAGPEREGEDRQGRIGGTPHQSTCRVAKIHDPALKHGTSRSHPVRARLEAGHPAPPAALQERRQRAERLPPGPAPRGPAAVAREPLLVLRLQIAKDFVALRQRQEHPKARGNGCRQAFGTAGVCRRSHQPCRQSILHCRNNGSGNGRR
jgi:hypothetical protein